MSMIKPARAYDVTLDKANEKKILQACVDELTAKVNEIISVDLVGSSVTVENVVLGTTNVEVTHNLGRVPKRLVSILLNAGVTVFSDTAHPTPLLKMYVKATATCTANLLIA